MRHAFASLIFFAASVAVSSASAQFRPSIQPHLASAIAQNEELALVRALLRGTRGLDCRSVRSYSVEPIGNVVPSDGSVDLSEATEWRFEASWACVDASGNATSDLKARGTITERTHRPGLAVATSALEIPGKPRD